MSCDERGDHQPSASAAGGRVEILSAVALHLGLAIWVFLPCLGPGLFPYGRDTLSHDILFFEQGWATVRGTGLVPLWNHHLFAGFPWVAAAGWTPWYPPHWVALVAPAAFAFTVQYLLHHAWAGLGFTVFGRALGLAPAAALLGGVLFQMSGHFTTLVYPGHLAKFEAIAWMPWVLAASLRASGGASARRALWGGVCLAMQVLTQHAQIVYYTVGLLVSLLALRLVSRRVCALPLCGLTLAAGASLALVQLLPAAEMKSVSNRAGGVSWREAVFSSYPPEELPELAWPGLFGTSVDGTYHGRRGERLVSDYLGLVTLAGVGLSLVLARGRTRLHVALLLALFGLSIGAALGEFRHVYGLLYEWLPGWRNWRSPATVMCVSTFAACTLAAMGWGALLTRRARLARWLAPVLIAAAVADQTRVARTYVQPAPVTLARMHESFWEIYPFSPAHRVFRSFYTTQEMSNVPMMERLSVPMGYHPIMLGRWQALVEALGFDDPDLHRLLAVRTWHFPPEMGLPPGYQPRRRRFTSEPLATAHWLAASRAAGGQLAWLPGTVMGFETDAAALEGLRAFQTQPRFASDERAIFSAAGITGLPGHGLEQPVEHPADFWMGLSEERASAEEEAIAESWPVFGVNRFSYPIGDLIESVRSSEQGWPEEGRWAVLSMFCAPGWQVSAVDRDAFGSEEIFRIGITREEREALSRGVPCPDRSRRVEVHPAWGALWAIHLTGHESILFAQCRPATVRLGFVVTLAALMVVLALFGRLPKNRGTRPSSDPA